MNEQTPIEELRFILKMNSTPSNGKVFIKDIDKFINEIEENILEQYANAKVLEALDETKAKEYVESLPYYGSCTTEFNEGFIEAIRWAKEQAKQK